MSALLLIEDDPDTGETIQAMLELDGHEVVWMNSGAKALAHLQARSETLDLILCDILMPGMDGLEVLMNVRKGGFSTPFISMTASRDALFLETACHLGASGTLAKPFSLGELRAAVHQACAK